MSTVEYLIRGLHDNFVFAIVYFSMLLYEYMISRELQTMNLFRKLNYGREGLYDFLNNCRRYKHQQLFMSLTGCGIFFESSLRHETLIFTKVINSASIMGSSLKREEDEGIITVVMEGGFKG